MSKKPEKDQIDKDLEKLYTSACKVETECPHCKQSIVLGGDFSEKAKAMALRLEWEKIKRSKGGPMVPSMFEDDKEES